MAAMLFKIEACVRLGYNKESCTSVPCKWNATFTKKVYISRFSYVLRFALKNINSVYIGIMLLI